MALWTKESSIWQTRFTASCMLRLPFAFTGCSVDAVELTQGLDEVVTAVLFSINGTVYVSIAALNSKVQTEILGGSFATLVRALSADLRTLDADLAAIVSLADQTQGDIDAIKTLSDQMDAGSTLIIDQIALINAQKTDDAGTFELTPERQFPTTAMPELVPSTILSLTNASAAVDQLRLDFVTVADDADKKLSDAEGQVNDEFNTVSSDFDDTINKEIGPDLNKLVADVQELVYETISENPLVISRYIEQGQEYLRYAQIVRIIYFVLVLVILIIFLVSVKQKMRRTLKVASCCAGMLWILAVLITLAFVIFNLLIGGFCQSYFIDGQDPLSEITSNQSQIILDAQNAIDSCIEGDSLLQATAEIVDLGDQLNMTKEVQKALDEVDWTSVTSVIDTLDISPDPIDDDLDPVLNESSTGDIDGISGVDGLVRRLG